MLSRGRSAWEKVRTTSEIEIKPPNWGSGVGIARNLRQRSSGNGSKLGNFAFGSAGSDLNTAQHGLTETLEGVRRSQEDRPWSPAAGSIV